MNKNDLLQIAKKRGLDVAEESLQAFGQASLDLVDMFAKTNKYFAILWGALENDARKELVQLIDKVDGEDDVKEGEEGKVINRD